MVGFFFQKRNSSCFSILINERKIPSLNTTILFSWLAVFISEVSIRFGSFFENSSNTALKELVTQNKQVKIPY